MSEYSAKKIQKRQLKADISEMKIMNKWANKMIDYLHLTGRKSFPRVEKFYNRPTTGSE